MIGATIIGISIIVIVITCSLAFTIGLFKHLLFREWEYVPMCLLGAAVFGGIILSVIGI